MRALTLLLILPLFPQDGVDEKTLKAWEIYRETEATYRNASTEASAKLRAALKEGQERKEALAEYRAATGKYREKMTEARDSFVEKFAASDWSSWDVDEHAKLMEIGFYFAGRHELEAGRLGKAMKAFTRLAEAVPSSVYAGNARLTIGDIHAALGNLDKAREIYGQVSDSGDKRKMKYADQRLALVGKVAPDIDSETWVGGEAKKLSQLKGKVVVVDFWATWCSPCRAVMPALSDLYEKKREQGVVVLGVTKFYANGYLARNKEEMKTGGESVRGMDEETYLEHITAFRKNTEMSYPFVVGVQKDFQNYKVSGIPTVAVIGTDGKVALLVVGSGSEALVKAVVDRELKKVRKEY